jgi:hypothetical protein
MPKQSFQIQLPADAFSTLLPQDQKNEFTAARFTANSAYRSEKIEKKYELRTNAARPFAARMMKVVLLSRDDYPVH